MVSTRSTPSSWKALCRAAGLEAPEAFWSDSEANIAAIFNGCGPDDFTGLPGHVLDALVGPDRADAVGRAILGRFLELFTPAFVIHDWEYHQSDRTEAGFHAANLRMLRNMELLLEQAHPFRRFWEWPERVRWWIRLRLAFRAVESAAGYQAWIT